MADNTGSAAKTPWHLWLVGVLALLWNAMGAMDFTLTQMHSEAWLKALTAEQRAVIDNFPLWSVIAWGTGTWGALLGSLLLLLRRGFASNLFAVSLLGMVLTNIYSYCLSDWVKVMNPGAGAYIFSAVIFVIGVMLFAYARAMRQRGVLR